MSASDELNRLEEAVAARGEELARLEERCDRIVSALIASGYLGDDLAERLVRSTADRPRVESTAGRRYSELLKQVQDIVGYELANELDEAVGERLAELLP